MGIDNAACEIESITHIDVQKTLEKKKNCCAEFFDPELPIRCLKVFFKKRESPIQTVMILIIICHLLNLSGTMGETSILTLLFRCVLNSDTSFLSYYNAYNIFAVVLGLFLVIGLNKIFKIKDITILLVTTCMTIVSKIVFAMSENKIHFLIGASVDFCQTSKTTAARNLVSMLVPATDLSSVFAIMGIVESGAGFVIPPLYSEVYQKLVKDQGNIGFIYLMSCIFLILSLVLYL